MAKISQKCKKVLIAVAKKQTEKDLNSASSVWVYQPELPKSAKYHKG